MEATALVVGSTAASSHDLVDTRRESHYKRRINESSYPGSYAVCQKPGESLPESRLRDSGAISPRLSQRSSYAQYRVFRKYETISGTAPSKELLTCFNILEVGSGLDGVKEFEVRRE